MLCSRPVSLHHRIGAGLALCTLLLTALSAPAVAQSTMATITGTVKDADDRPAAEIFVQARNPETGEVRSTVTDEAGRYRLELPPGEWMVVSRRHDGTIGESRAVRISLQQQFALNLSIGKGLNEEVTVEAESPLVDPGRSGAELRVGREQINNLPLAGRDPTDLARLDSSVLIPTPGQFYGERDAVFSVNGQSGRSNSFLVDGLDNNDLTSGTTLNSFFSQQVIREFVLMTNQYAPEFGRASGGIMNIVTERGTNEHRVEAFVQGADSSLNQPGEFIDSLPDQEGISDTGERLQTGFKWGGPLKDDKAFFFVAYEHQEIDKVVPYTGVDRDGVAGGYAIAPDRDDNIFLRTDFNLNERNFLMVRFSGDDRQTTGINIGGRVTPESGFRFDERDWQIASTLTSVLSSGAINEARLLIGSSSLDQFANSDRVGVNRPGGVFGGNDLNLQLRDEERLAVVDNVTWTRGAHSFKAGASVDFSETSIRTRFNPNGSFLYETDLPFEPGDCGNLLQSDVRDLFLDGGDKLDPIPCPGVPFVDDDGDLLIDEPGIIGTYPVTFLLVDGEPEATLDDTIVGVFFQDRWQATPKLQFDYGLRYDLSTYTLPSSARVDSTIPNGGASRDEDNLAPRIGFTYTPGDSGRTVLRGGAGIFYDKIVLGFAGVANITSGTELGIIAPQGFTFEFTEETIETFGIDAIKSELIFPEQLTLRFSTDTELETPYTVQYNLGIERAIGPRSAWRANITRAQGYHAVLLKDINPADSFTGTGIPIHRDPTTGSIAAFSTEGRTWYTGLDLGLAFRGDRGNVSASYTLSKAEDMGFDPLRGGIYLPPDSDEIFNERGRAAGDRRHRFVLYGEAPLPFLGLRTSGVLQLASGAPFNVTTGTDDNVDGVLSERPEGVGRSKGENSNLASINALRQEFGLPSVGSLNEPSFFQFDLRVAKPFDLAAGRGNGEFFVQVFNVFDTENDGLIEGRVNSAQFGRALARVGPPRTFELGLRVGF